MTDIAKIGFAADTSELDKAVASLNKLNAAAAGTSSAAGKVTSTLNRIATTTSSAFSKVSAATSSAVKATVDYTSNVIKMVSQNSRLVRSQATVASSFNKTATSIQKAASAQEILNRAQRGGFGGAGGRRGGGGNRQTGQSATGVGRDQMPNRFNTANIAAQFQDIGVTAAMGMNPMMIAMQQGTQLSAIMTSMENPLKGLAVAFKQVFGSTAILTIGIVALVAAGLQMVDWISVAKFGLNALASALEFIEPAILPIGAAMLVAFGPAAVSAIIATTKAVAVFGYTALKAGASAAAAWAMANPITAFVAILAAVGVFVVAAVKPIRDFTNTVIGYFVGMYNGIKKTWTDLPNMMGESVFNGVNAVIGGFESMINTVASGIDNLLSKLPEWMGGGVKIGQISLSRVDNPYKGALEEFNATMSTEIGKALGKDYVGGIGEGIASGVDAAAGKLRQIAAGLGTDKDGKTKKDPWTELVKGADRRIATLEAEGKAIGQSVYETARLKYETDLLNEAQQKNIQLTPEQTTKIQELAATMAGLEENNKRVSQSLELARGTSSGFIKDFVNGLKQGENAWDSFKNAAINALNSVLDALIDLNAKMFAESISSSGGGFMGSLMSAFGASGSSAGISNPNIAGTTYLMAANGAAFSNGVQAFANGGTFTNGIYSSPQLFQFANGGSFGVMGEAGPEAVMPLKRGSDGSLGVEVVSAGKSLNVNVEVIVNGNATVEQESETMSDGSEMRRFIINTVNEANALGQFDSSNAGRYNIKPRQVTR